MIQKVEMTDRNFIENDLLLSGYSRNQVAALTAYLDDESSPITPDCLLSDYRLSVVHTLSSAWLVCRLRALADGNDPAVAVAALEQLVKISLHGGIQPLTSLDTDSVLNNLS